jgi:hypothetical protein
MDYCDICHDNQFETSDMKRFAVILLTLAIAGGTASAQGALLKNIGGRVVNKVENKVEKKVEDKANQKVDKVLGRIFGEDPQQATQAEQATAVANDYSGYSSTASTYGSSLMDADYHKDYYPVSVNPSYKFTSYKDALKARMDLPKPGTLNSEKDLEAYAAKVAELKQATEDICIKYTQQQSALNTQAINGPYAGGSKSKPTVNVSAEEVMQAIKAKGLDPATASEAQMQDAVADYVAKKMGVSKAQALEMMSKSDAPQNRMDQIAAELAGIYEGRTLAALNNTSNALTSLGTALLSGRTTVDETTMTGALFNLSKRIASSWAKSDECKMVNKLEREQGLKGRDKQNEIIDKWNSKQLDIWVAKIARFADAEYADAQKVADLDAELEAMSATDKKTANWASAKIQAVNLASLIINSMSIPTKVFECPLVSHASTDI